MSFIKLNMIELLPITYPQTEDACTPTGSAGRSCSEPELIDPFDLSFTQVSTLTALI